MAKVEKKPKGTKNVIRSSELDPKFKYEVAGQPGGEKLKVCYACGVCTAGCPVSEVSEDFDPRKIIRMVLMGMKERVLSSDFIWYCTQCFTCSGHCPQNVKFTDIMRVLRDMAVKKGYVDSSFLQKAKELDRFSQKVRHRLMKSIVAKKGKPFTLNPGELLSRVAKELA
ncbi:MAG: 4Fe-4S dicluster domain-containing protein [Thermodesulfobacteriota bacterium]